ncbi:MAG: tetraacyldisaccharide 4'-kinase [Planctomycetota bacterium]
MVPRLLRALLGAAAAGYSPVVRLSNFFYSKGLFKAHCVNLPVFCVGNITVGGTGKTPLVVWLYKRIISSSKFGISGSECAILTRGYKAAQNSGTETQDFRDEIAILAESCPGAKVVVNPDRVVGAAQAIGNFGARVLIMDDGFQHRRFARDLDIVAIDATRPFGYGRLFPAGLLREPVASLKRAGAVVITRCDQVGESELHDLERKLLAVNPSMVIARSTHSPVCAKTANGEEVALEQLQGKKIFAFCGIGNPEAFLRTVENLGCELVGSGIYNDHYHYTQRCLDEIYEQAARLRADLILTTQKDWTKIAPLVSPGRDLRLAYLAIEIEFLAGEDKLTALIEETLAGTISKTVDD